jgi:hypothetical protein
MRDDLIEDITQLCESDVLRDLSDQHHATRAHGNQPKRIGRSNLPHSTQREEGSVDRSVGGTEVSKGWNELLTEGGGEGGWREGEGRLPPPS